MRGNRLIALLLALLCPLLLAACGTKADTAQEAPEAEAGLKIDGAALTGEPSFIDWNENGTDMQLIARKDEGGAVRLAFNTCQSCGGSPYAWFEYLGDGVLQCQNCGLTFALDTVGTEKAAGCNPVTITDFAVDGDAVTVPAELLGRNAKLFTNWKNFDA